MMMMIIIIIIIVVVVVVVVVIIIIIIIIIIALKDAVRDVLQSPHCVAKCLQYMRSSGQGAVVYKSRATHQALVTCSLSCATW